VSNVNVIVPYCAGDQHLLAPCLQSLFRFQPDASVALMATHRLTPEQGEATVALTKSLDRGSVPCFERNYIQMYPGVAAWALAGSAEISRTYMEDRPFLYCEPDVTFTREGCLDSLYTEWSRWGMPVLGALTQTYPVGLYCNGVAVYGPGAILPEGGSVFDETELTACTEIAFDVQLRHKVLPQMWNTNLIEQVPRTRHWTDQETTPISAVSVLTHGVKDGSLWEWLKMKRRDSNP